MNEDLIKSIIKCKMNVADKMLGRLPIDLSRRIKEMGNTVLNGIQEGVEEIKKQPLNEKTDINNIKIE